eukprot:jgi/Astpho2/6783/e_gw1.00103.33.1_t
MKRNRYTDVLPFDESRVLLEGLDCDYINASILTSRENEQPPYQYIATQGPLASTTADFWQMVAEQGTSVVVMLTRCMEADMYGKLRQKCHSYFPDQLQSEEAYGQLSVTVTEKEDIDGDITKRSLSLKHRESGASRTVTHYHYHAWPDRGIPRTTLPLRRLARLLDATDDPQAGPPVVHCSAGIGRTGVFLTINIVMRRLRKLDPVNSLGECSSTAVKAVDLKRVVANLRKQRAGMVQTEEQYIFCYHALLEELKEVLGPMVNQPRGIQITYMA